MLRVIYSIECELEPGPGSPPGASSALIITLNRDGVATGRNGRPRPPKTRTIDLRVGDDVMVDGRWRRVLGIKAYRETYATPEQAAAITAGYVVQSTT
jgi:hypothetical protein